MKIEILGAYMHNEQKEYIVRINLEPTSRIVIEKGRNNVVGKTTLKKELWGYGADCDEEWEVE
jgi:hypothetical protein